MSLSLNKVYNLLPSDIKGWKKTDPPIIYTQDTLYDYINGGAELYIAYNFKEVLSVKYEKEKNSEIIIDFFDMGSSYDAYGIFSQGREKEDGLLGQGSEYSSGLLSFWKGQYFISILAYPETEEKKGIVLALGKILEDSIPLIGDSPPILKLLPDTIIE